MEIKLALKEWGLTENEIEIYLLLVNLGSATASEIIEKTNIHRINVYDILERLQEKGLAAYVFLGKRKNYEVTNPKKLLEILDEKRERIKEILPELLLKKSQTKKGPEAAIFKDKKGIKNIMEEITKSKTEVLLFASGWGFKEYFPEYYEAWHARFSINKVKIRMLLSEKQKEKTRVPNPLSSRFLSSGLVFPSTTLVFEDKIFMIMWSEQPIGILIRGKQSSDSYREFFEILWKNSKK